MKISKEIKTGLIVTIGIGLLWWGVNYLKGKDLFTRQQQFYAVYSEVEGLAASNPVMVNGMKVGMVHSLTLRPEDKKILVVMHITNAVQLPKNTKAEIFATDLLGSKGIKLVLGESTETAKDGDTLETAVEQSLPAMVSAQVAPIKAKAENLLSSIDSVLLIVRGVFNEGTKSNLRRSFESISNSLTSIEHITGSMDTVLAKEGRLKEIFLSLESISANLKANNENITKIITNFSAISDTIAQSKLSETLAHTQKTLEQTAGIMEKVNRGDGTLGQLANNDSLYHNLNSTARDLDSFLSDFKQNPRKYLKVSLISFGK